MYIIKASFPSGELVFFIEYEIINFAFCKIFLMSDF